MNDPITPNPGHFSGRHDNLADWLTGWLNHHGVDPATVDLEVLADYATDAFPFGLIRPLLLQHVLAELADRRAEDPTASWGGST